MKTKLELSIMLDNAFLQPLRYGLIISATALFLSPALWAWYSFSIFWKVCLTLFLLVLALYALYWMFKKAIDQHLSKFKDGEIITKDKLSNL